MSEPPLDAVRALENKHNILIFTGAGISVESGIPPFRGRGGLFEREDPSFIEIGHFTRSPGPCWKKLKSIFYENWGEAKPNPAHIAIAQLQKTGVVSLIVTQNIDCLHQRAGATGVIEFHGSLDRLICTRCNTVFPTDTKLLTPDIPVCPKCSGLLKPDVVFYGEPIPAAASDAAFSAVRTADAVLVVGTAGEVMPACLIPHEAKRAGAVIIEVNLAPSAFTGAITDIFLQGQAGKILPDLIAQLQARHA